MIIAILSFELIFRSFSFLIKRKMQYMKKIYEKYIDFDASIIKKHILSFTSQMNFDDFENLKHIF